MKEDGIAVETADASDHENSHAVIKGDKTAKVPVGMARDPWPRDSHATVTGSGTIAQPMVIPIATSIPVSGEPPDTNAVSAS